MKGSKSSFSVLVDESEQEKGYCLGWIIGYSLMGPASCGLNSL